MQEYIIVITPDEEIQTLPFDGTKSLQEAVDGTVCLVGTKSLMVAPDVFDDDKILIVFYMDKYYARKHYGKGDIKVNAIASSLVGKPVYGKVAFVRDIQEGNEKGFSDISTKNTISEKDYLCSILNGLIQKTKSDLQRLHEIWDNKLPEPTVPIRPLQKRNGNRFQKQ